MGGVAVVFDGTSHFIVPTDEVEDFEVIYIGDQETADDMVENLNEQCNEKTS